MRTFTSKKIREAMNNKTQVGKQGEEAACLYLTSKGYSIRARNWRHFHRELDIVAETDEKLVVIEVKLRHETAQELARDCVSTRKARLVIDAADAYIQQHNIDKEVRFDLIAITQGAYGLEIEHIEDAFQPEW